MGADDAPREAVAGQPGKEPTVVEMAVRQQHGVEVGGRLRARRPVALLTLPLLKQTTVDQEP